MSKNHHSKERMVNGKKLECLVCNHSTFWAKETLMNTAKMTFFNLDWLNKSALNYICSNCGFVHWFMNK